MEVVEGKNGGFSAKVVDLHGTVSASGNNLIAAGDDYRPSARWQIGTLAFENVSFSA